jgi:Fe-S-cluster containining protein
MLTPRYVPDEALQDHLTRVAQRNAEIFTPEGYAIFQAKADRAIAATDKNAVSVALQRAHKAPAMRARILWIRKAGDHFAEGLKTVAPCTSGGCSDCCSQAVIISRAEAEILAAETGAYLERNPAYIARIADAMSRHHRNFDRDTAEKYTAVPCIFLKAGRCSIYEHRPIACRVHFTLDRDNLLCRFIKGQTNRIPGLDIEPIMGNLARVIGTDSNAADHTDIRDWFPKGLNK